MQSNYLIKDPAQNVWLQFQNLHCAVSASALNEVLPVLQQVEAEVTQGKRFALGFISYEASPAFDRSYLTHPVDDFPLVWFGIFDQLERLPTLPRPKISLESPDLASVKEPPWIPSVSRAEYDAAIAAVKEQIALGYTYQVNYTLRLSRAFTVDPYAFFYRLVKAQPSAYSAYLELDRWVVCSVSPELFFERNGVQLTAKPMKGTAGRGRWAAEDQEQARWLETSIKNRAENVMIVDMLRNDLGKIARTGSVRTPELFTLEKYPTVWQMTSTITAESDASLTTQLTALFPCASITGAPKASTMRIIHGLETTPRRLYTGCIGFMLPEDQARFSVAIRTVLIDKKLRLAEYGVGGGIVWDSQSAEEYEECLAKALVLTREKAEFELLESLLWEPQTGYYLLEGHLKRLNATAEYFQYPLDLALVQCKLAEITNDLPHKPHKIRLLVKQSGEMTCQAETLAIPHTGSGSIASPGGPVLRLGIAKTPVLSKSPFLFHKTTQRRVYIHARREYPGVDDVVLWNERGEVTETTTNNLVFLLDGEWVTPPLSSGLLPGVYRQFLLDEKKIVERTVLLADLPGCEQIRVINSVRKVRQGLIV